jgi:hypothetical protein
MKTPVAYDDVHECRVLLVLAPPEEIATSPIFEANKDA